MARENRHCPLIMWLSFILMSLTVWAQDTITFNYTYDFNLGYETGTTVITLPDGYLVCATGAATEYDGWRGLKLMKTDLYGNEEWRKVYGQETKGYSSGWYGALTRVDDGGYFLAAGIVDSGNNYCRGILYRFDERGDTIWTQTFEKPGYSFFNSGRQTKDGGFVAIGVQYVSGIRKYWLVKTDSLGIAELDTLLGTGYASTIEVTHDGGYIIGGAGGNFLSDARIVKLDSSGNIQWDRYHFGSNQQGCYWSAGLASDGGYYIWGCYDTIINPTDFFLTASVAKLDSLGNRVWTNHYRGLNNKLIAVYQVKELPDGNIIIGGEKDNDNLLLSNGGWLIKADNTGSTIWERIHITTQDSSVILGPNCVYDFDVDTNNNLIITGYTYTDIDPGPLFNTNQDIWLLKLDSLGNWYAPPDTSCPLPCDTTGIGNIEGANASIYPNPTNGTIIIELPRNTDGHSFALYNLLGELLLETPLSNTRTSINIGFPAGLYLYRITAPGGQIQTGKLVVE